MINYPYLLNHIFVLASKQIVICRQISSSMRLHGLIITLLCCSVFSFVGRSQSPEGLPRIRNYSPQEYGSHRQNWAIAQSPDGIMYFANGKGLLSFNGEEWRLAMIPNRGHVRSLAVDNDGTVYVGAQNDFGQLVPNKDGELQFKSYLSRIPAEHRSFGRIRKTVIHEEDVYFQAESKIFRVREDTVKIWQSDEAYRRLFVINDNVFLSNLYTGLSKLSSNDKFEVVPGGEFFTGMKVNIMVPYGEDILIGTGQRGLFRYNSQNFVPFVTGVDDYLIKYDLQGGLITQKNKLIFRLGAAGGIVVLSREGKLEQIIRQESGLTSSNVLSIFEDNHNSLWAGLQEGLARIELTSPFSVYDERLGLNGSVQSILQHQGKLYAATSEGLSVLKQGGFNRGFEQVKGLINYGWDLESWNDQLLIGTSNGAYAIVNDQLEHVLNEGFLAAAILTSEYNENTVFVADDHGFSEYQWMGARWEKKGGITGITGSVRDIIETDRSSFWLKTRSNGIFRITLPLSEGSLHYNTPKIEHYLASKGVPVGENNLFMVNGTLYVRSENDSLYKYSAKEDRFYPDVRMGRSFNIEDGYLLPKKVEKEGTLWLDHYVDNRKYIIRVEKNLSGQYSTRAYPVSSLEADYSDPFSNEVFYAKSDHAWFGGMKGILQYDLNEPTAFDKSFEVILGKAMARDSMIYSNYWDRAAEEIPYAQNDLVFHFACPIYRNGERLTYQYYLNGFDQMWSQWTPESRKEYTSLPVGDYTFMVKAKNDYGVISNIRSFGFSIKPPWYRSVAAFVVYVAMTGALIWLIIYLRSKKYEEENLRLENIIQERTLEIKEQADKITELYEVKSQFLANISHELRTPLTLILGPVENLLQAHQGEEKQQLLWIKRNGQRLLKLINQLLDQSKIEAGELGLRVSYENLIPFSRGILMSFESLASQKNIELSFQSVQKELFLYIDVEKLEQVLINLLSNAVKFTPEGGHVSMIIDVEDENASIKVSDTGIGIDSQHLPHIFERFFQVENPDTKSHQGTGIGLSLSRDLVELHSGTLHAESELGRGTTFGILLPVGREHLKEDQIVTTQEAHRPEMIEPVPYEIKSEEPQEQHQSSLPLLLIVDDNEDMRQFIQFQLKQDYNVIQASDGFSGWETALEHLPDLIISDVMMPGMNGFDLCQKLKKDLRTDHIPVILLTAKAGQEEKIKGLEMQADDYLGKPFEARELAIRVKNLISGRKHLQKRFAEKIVFKPEEIAVTSQEEAFLKKLIDIVEENLSNQQFNVNVLCQEMAISKSQLNRKMQAILNKGPNAFIRSYRLERGKQLIENNTGTLAEISYDVGFSSPAYFSKCFHDEFGYTPKSLKS